MTLAEMAALAYADDWKLNCVGKSRTLGYFGQLVRGGERVVAEGATPAEAIEATFRLYLVLHPPKREAPRSVLDLL